ncbi:MAG: M20/M25/M40 family metallo-hydrolase [Asgard group archaeon]|nr:M20/M25/M40 family metallo-hydrolase [Asgard group archaeon]
MKSYMEILKKLVSYQTTNNPMEQIIPDPDILGYIKEELFSHLGYETILYERNGYWSLVAYLKRKKPNALFIGHCDVVPPGPEWVTDPFELTIKEDKAYGRGAADMKGSVAVMLDLAEDFLTKTECSIIIAINLDEESGGNDGAGQLMPILEDLDLVPTFVINGDANGLQIVNRRRNPFAIVLSVPKSKIRIKGKRESRTFKTEIAGNRTMHAAYFMRDVDIHCADKASSYLKKGQCKACNMSGTFVKNNVLPSEITIECIIPDEENGKILDYDENLTNFLYSVTEFNNIDVPSNPSDYGINLTFNYYKEESENHLFQMDLRIMSKSHEDVRTYFEKFVRKFSIPGNIDVRGSIGPVNTPEDSLLITKAVEIAKNLHLSENPIEMGGATDSRFFSALQIPAIEFGPLGGNVHGSNEYVEIGSLEIVRNFYLKLVQNLERND